MDFFQAVLIGIVHGITAFLPVSSSGHAGLIEDFFHIGGPETLLFEALLHLATLFAIVLAFWRDIQKIAAETILISVDVLTNIRIFVENKKNGADKRYQKISGTNYRKLTLLLMVAVIPMAALGVSSRHLVQIAFGSPMAIGIGMMTSAILLLVIDFIAAGDKIPKDMTYDRAVWMGICQGIASFPGISRTGVSMSVGLLCGLNRKVAVKFTFLMAIPAVLGALILELGQLGEMSISGKLFAYYFCGALVAGVIGFFLIRRMTKYLQRARFRGFACYNFFLGIVAIVSSVVK
ncbi:MAG: undecaprenyl-diphosphate phosphatase [Lachnospiraceae bacterium]|nr:undecaprenyl-diphosphate phosphatase [Lachnospiraceae bacterium]